MADIALLAPMWLQLSHLLLADAVWVTLVLLTAVALADRLPAPASEARPALAEPAVATGTRA
jgi:hypothetical protein